MSPGTPCALERRETDGPDLLDDATPPIEGRNRDLMVARRRIRKVEDLEADRAAAPEAAREVKVEAQRRGRRLRQLVAGGNRDVADPELSADGLLGRDPGRQGDVDLVDAFVDGGLNLEDVGRPRPGEVVGGEDVSLGLGSSRGRADQGTTQEKYPRGTSGGLEHRTTPPSARPAGSWLEVRGPCVGKCREGSPDPLRNQAAIRWRRFRVAALLANAGSANLGSDHQRLAEGALEPLHGAALAPGDEPLNPGDDTGRLDAQRHPGVASRGDALVDLVGEAQ